MANNKVSCSACFGYGDPECFDLPLHAVSSAYIRELLNESDPQDPLKRSRTIRQRGMSRKRGGFYPSIRQMERWDMRFRRNAWRILQRRGEVA